MATALPKALGGLDVRICMVTSVPMPPTEGVGYYVWNLSNFLKERGHQVQIITRGQRGKNPYEELARIPIWRPRFHPIFPLHVHFHKLFVQRLVRHLEAKVDVFHLHTPLPPTIHSDRPTMLTVHSMMMPDTMERKVDSVFELLTRLQSPISFSIEKRLLRTSQTVTAVSRVAAEHAQQVLSQNGRRVEITWNGVDTSFFSPRARNAALPDHLLFVGRLAPGKGLEELVQALDSVTSQHPGTKMFVAGDGPMQNRISSLITQRRLKKNVRLLGHVSSRKALRALYQQAWALVLPSHHESFPTVILEAMACGTPVIATRVGSVPDAITDGVNGLLISPRAPEQLAAAICRLRGDAELRARLGEAAHRTVTERFSWQVVGSNYVRHYRALLNGADK